MSDEQKKINSSLATFKRDLAEIIEKFFDEVEDLETTKEASLTEIEIDGKRCCFFIRGEVKLLIIPKKMIEKMEKETDEKASKIANN